MGPENTMPSEINQVEKDTHRNSIDWWLPGAEGWRNGQQVQIYSYKMNQILGYNEQYGNTS